MQQSYGCRGLGCAGIDGWGTNAGTLQWGSTGGSGNLRYWGGCCCAVQTMKASGILTQASGVWRGSIRGAPSVQRSTRRIHHYWQLGGTESARFVEMHHRPPRACRPSCLRSQLTGRVLAPISPGPGGLALARCPRHIIPECASRP